jgi:sugar/nucleoside kinase (ribokinase family)
MLGEEQNLLILQKIEKHSLIRPDCSQVTNQKSKYKAVTAISTIGAGDGASGGLQSPYLLLYSPSPISAYGQFL